MTPARMAELHALGFPDGHSWSEAEIAAMLARPAIRSVTDGVDGFALLQILPPDAEVLTLAVAPDARRRGRGAALLAAALACARQAGARNVFLEVGAANTAAQALYAAAGFRQVGSRKGYYAHTDGRREDALILARSQSGEKPEAGTRN